MDTTPTTVDVVGEKKEEHTNNTSAAPAEKQAEKHSSATGEEEEEFAPEKMLVTQLKGELARRGFRSTGRKVGYSLRSHLFFLCIFFFFKTLQLCS